MPKFTDQDAKQLNSPPGDYILQVLSFNKGLSKGAKTVGCDDYELKLLVEKNADGKGGSEMREHLIDHENLLWKWDTFLKSCGVVISKGESYTFDTDDAKAQNIRHIDVVGLRGWATIRMKTPQNANEAPKFNEVATWITNKEKLKPVVENPEW